MPTEITLRLHINGEQVRRIIPAHRSLLDFIREDLRLTGSKHGCDVGDCGACTVLVDGAPRLACITLAAECEGAAVRTIEGVTDGAGLHPIQEALHRHVGAQCGYCTPGIVMAMTSLLEADPHPSDGAINEALGSNICRCTGYTKILAAVREVARPGSPS
jgi:aerobic-type carbon monoxide dehydrogenase small subunit (CoxS/CutS family)